MLADKYVSAKLDHLIPPRATMPSDSCVYLPTSLILLSWCNFGLLQSLQGKINQIILHSARYLQVSPALATSCIPRLPWRPNSSTGCAGPCPPAGVHLSGLQSHHLLVGTWTLAAPTVCCTLDQTQTGLASLLGPLSRSCQTVAFRSCPSALHCHPCRRPVPCSSIGTPTDLVGLATSQRLVTPLASTS